METSDTDPTRAIADASRRSGADEDHEMTDAPPQNGDASLGQQFSHTDSKFIPPASNPGSPLQEQQPSNDPSLATAINTEVLESTEQPTMPAPKKKGQATTKKASAKKPRGGGAASATKSAKKPASKAKQAQKQQAPEAAADDDDDEDDAAASGSEMDESDNGPYCICRGPDDHRFMIGCDICEDWFHGECVKIDKDVGENLIERFVCPGCTDLDRNLRTVFKKTCSYRNCITPARLYDGRDEKSRSVFCSDEHKQLWWEMMMSELPKKSSIKASMRDELTQEEFMALLSSDLVKVDKKEGSFKVTTRPFAPAEDENGSVESKKPVATAMLTQEEENLIQTSASERYKMGEEIVLCQKMLQLIDMASDRRKALISAKQLDDAACGYDFRLDTVGAQAPFARWLATDEGKEIFRAAGAGGDGNDKGSSLGYGSVLSGEGKNICDKKRCKPHQGWYGIHTRDVKHQMKQLAADANRRLDRERAVRSAAVERRLRKTKEKNQVHYYDADGNVMPRS